MTSKQSFKCPATNDRSMRFFARATNMFKIWRFYSIDVFSSEQNYSNWHEIRMVWQRTTKEWNHQKIVFLVLMPPWKVCIQYFFYPFSSCFCFGDFSLLYSMFFSFQFIHIWIFLRKIFISRKTYALYVNKQTIQKYWFQTVLMWKIGVRKIAKFQNDTATHWKLHTIYIQKILPIERSWWVFASGLHEFWRHIFNSTRSIQITVVFTSVSLFWRAMRKRKKKCYRSLAQSRINESKWVWELDLKNRLVANV